jgi:Uma2 family endonuclease
MAESAPAESKLSSQRSLPLGGEGVLPATRRVELLEGGVMTMSPMSAAHAVATEKTAAALRSALAARAIVRVRQPLLLGAQSVPEPDVAVVPGAHDDYAARHPASALLVVEVADDTLGQDRGTKAPIYAAAGVPEYWIVNLRDDRVETYRFPDPTTGAYRVCLAVPRGGRIEIGACAGTTVEANDLLPRRAGSGPGSGPGSGH